MGCSGYRSCQQSPRRPFRDTEASRAAADRVKRQRDGGKPKAKLVRRQWMRRTPELGGHAPEKTCRNGTRSGWRCKVCKHQSADFRKLASQRCEGSAASRWATKAVKLAEAGATVGRGHTRVLSGETLWCLTCGAFADTKAVQLSGICNGAPTVWKQGRYGGMWGQKLKLLKGIHPRHGTGLPPPIFEDGTCVHTGACRRPAAAGREQAAFHETKRWCPTLRLGLGAPFALLH